MKELKFRFWNTTCNKLVYLERYKLSDMNGQLSFIDLFNDNRGWIWEQYTGLKDRDGKEIYEGDIIKVIGYGLYEVFWRKWDSSFTLRPIDESVVVENKVLMLCEDWEEEYKVIGNIHEDKELLGGKDE